MTYNFDPDRWYEIRRARLEAGYETGSITREEYEGALEELDRRYDEMWNRLDGTFQTPE